MPLTLGQRLVRLDDGMKGTVKQYADELRVLYLDRGEERLAPKGETWVADEIAPGPLHTDEMRLIAHYADRALRAHERHEPFKYWEKPNLLEIYDSGFVETILAYLSKRAAPIQTG